LDIVSSAAEMLAPGVEVALDLDPNFDERSNRLDIGWVNDAQVNNPPSRELT
jgi:hypothetical protein